MPLPPLPGILLREVEDLSPTGEAGFLTLRRQRLELAEGPGSPSAPFVYDHVSRNALDAVVVAAHYQHEGRHHVYLRSALRPPVAMRPSDRRPFAERDSLGLLWELPAGLVEPDEYSREGLVRCAARELEEELGFACPVDDFAPLGPATFPTAGVIGERHHFFHVSVVPAERGEPDGDGSVLEEGALIVAVPLSEALAALRDGEIEDAKTELGLRRLAELLNER